MVHQLLTGKVQQDQLCLQLLDHECAELYNGGQFGGVLRDL